MNACFWAALASWMVAQCTKMMCGFYRTRRLDFQYLVSTGGMPSAHSASAVGLATAIGIRVGFGEPLFALSLGLALLVMFDASTVRRAAGMQAALLNQIVDELFKEHHLSERKLKELLGHTRLEVFMGMLIGVFTAMLMMSLPFWR
ncbi:MAG: divergent PAP2 family protein [Lentisphaerae bacterium]|nr:divergent PAP2 family protein [Lentisphaerota bacterium]